MTPEAEPSFFGPSPRLHRISRRLFLSELGRNTLAVAVLGSGLVACGDNPSAAPPSDGEDDGEAAATTALTEAGDGALRWERVDRGIVSAYVLARGSEVAIVDTGTARSGPAIEAALSTLGAGWADVDHVIVTHAHDDHVGGLDEVLMAATAAVGYAGAGDIDQLRAPRDLVAVADGDEVFGLRVLATPGHTPGHISVFDPETGLLVAGDALVSDAGGRIAGPNPGFTDDLELAHESVRGLPADEVTTILVGHGEPVLDDGGAQLAELAASL